MSYDNVVQFGDYKKQLNKNSMQFKTFDGADLPTLWDYSLNVYTRDGVSKACLALQNYFGLDVNMVLYCLWAGKQGFQLTHDDMATISQTPHSWQVNTVMPLRATRMRVGERMTGPHADVIRGLKETYEDLKNQELDAERMEQELIMTAHNRLCADGMIWESQNPANYGLQNLAVYADIYATFMVMNDDMDTGGKDHSEVAQVEAILESLYFLATTD